MPETVADCVASPLLLAEGEALDDAVEDIDEDVVDSADREEVLDTDGATVFEADVEPDRVADAELVAVIELVVVLERVFVPLRLDVCVAVKLEEPLCEREDVLD